YSLAGLIYFGHQHFVARVISDNGAVYFHDGLDGPSTVFEGVLDDEAGYAWLRSVGGKKVSMALYRR
ncbi:hypothetical protein BKA70DRAFT_1046077, partial [Coprinopsis sp. MPI-PUGE-AT-0042]